MENKFLLIDDNKGTNFINKTILKKALATDVLVAENGQEAITIIKNGFAPEIIFLDINMPVMNGWEFLEAFQNFGITSKIVIMIGEELTSKEYDLLSAKYQVKTFTKKILDKDSLYTIMNYQEAV